MGSGDHQKWSGSVRSVGEFTLADESLIALAAAVADGVPIDWMSATQTLGTETSSTCSMVCG